MLSKDPMKKVEAKLSKLLTNLDKISELPSELRRRLTPAQSYIHHNFTTSRKSTKVKFPSALMFRQSVPHPTSLQSI